jgi:hypothetical protein
MATAAITLTSADIAGDPVNISNTSTLTKADSHMGLDQTTGLTKIIVTTASTHVILPSQHTLGTGKSAKVFITNLSANSTEFITVTINAQPLGKLYAGQWAYFPWSQLDANSDVKIAASAAGKSIPVEYMLMHEGYEFA